MNHHRKILFVCVENSCRSQIAEAFAKIDGEDIFEAYSAGSHPSGEVNPRAIASMQRIGYDMASHHSKSLLEVPDITYDFVITMGCGDACPDTKALVRLDWDITDPKEMPPLQFDAIRDLIRSKIRELIIEYGLRSPPLSK